MNIEQICYQGITLDRASELRKSTDWLDQQWHHPDCRFLLLHNDKNLMDWNHQQTQSPVAVYHSRKHLKHLTSDAENAVFLGMNAQQPVFAVNIETEAEAQQLSTQETHQFVDLRAVGCLFNAEDAAILAYARGLLYWNRHYLYCNRCGSQTLKQQGGHAKQCSHQDCRHVSFPRTDPAVIMLIENQSTPGLPKCLLARNARFPNRMMSTLAGFVDPSESLEETVAREAFEEAGIQVDQINYQASQPWPFPGSIMLGFRARASTTEIQVDGVEIEEAHWFSADELDSFGEWGDGNSHYCLPKRDSIARYLIESWKSEVRSKP